MSQLEEIVAIGQADIVADINNVRRIINGDSATQPLPSDVFTGEKDVATFEAETGFLPEGTALLLTGKGWDNEISGRLASSMVDGASRGSTTYASQQSLDAVTGFVSLVTVPDTNRETFSITDRDIIDNAVLRNPLIQPRACKVSDGTLYCVTENNVCMVDSDGNADRIHDSSIGTAHDLSFWGQEMAIASSDTDQLLILDRQSGRIKRAISMIDHGYHLSIGNLGGTDKNGFYIFPDQVPIMNSLRPEAIAVSSIRALLADRVSTQKVPTREQTTHVNSVQFLAPDTLLATIFNSAVVDEHGAIGQAPGGKVVMARFGRHTDTDSRALHRDLSAASDTSWTSVESYSPYRLPDQSGLVRKTTYATKPGESLLVREGVDDEGHTFTDIERITTLADGLRNPHSVTMVDKANDGTVMLSVSNTSAGEIIYYRLHLESRQMRRIGGLDFRNLPGLPPSGNHWIHHIVEPTVLPNGDVTTTVFDGSRRGVHILNLTRQQRMFVPVAKGAVVYQTQLIV